MTTSNFTMKDAYIERNDINDFLRDHKVVSEIYNIVLRQNDEMSSRQLTGIFNFAYRICTIATDKRGSLEDVRSLIIKTRRTNLNQKSIMVAAWCLLRLHEGLVYVSEEISSYLRDWCRQSDAYSVCQHFIRNFAGSFDQPINFSGRAIELAIDSEDSDDVEKVFVTKHGELLSSAKKLIENNRILREDMRQLKIKHAKEIESRMANESVLGSRLEESEKKVKDLQSQIERLQMNPRTIIKEVEKPVRVRSIETSVFSPQNIANYAIGLPTDEEANSIANCMSQLCVRENYYDPEVFNIIGSIQQKRTDAKLEMERKQQKKSAITFNIESVGQLNPTASSVSNQYERKSFGGVLNQFFDELDIDAIQTDPVKTTIDLSEINGGRTLRRTSSSESKKKIL